MIPFELSRFDGGMTVAGGSASRGRVADRIMEVAKVWGSVCRLSVCTVYTCMLLFQ